MSVTYIIDFQVRPQRKGEFDRLLGEVLDAMRRERSFCSAALLVDPDDECHLALVETWADHGDVVDVQLRRQYREAWHASLPDLLERDREVSMWHPSRADNIRID